VQNSGFKITVTLFFLSAFLFLRVANAHTIVHFFEDANDTTHCELCEIITTSQQQDLVLDNSKIPSTEHFNVVLKQKNSSNYKAPTLYFILLEHLHNLPPPTA
jgi:hypothetical protein